MSSKREKHKQYNEHSCLSVVKILLTVALLGCTDGLRLMSNQTESNLCPQNRSAEGLPLLKKCDFMLQTVTFWKHIEQKLNDRSVQHCKTRSNMSMIVQRLNARFAAGEPSDNVNAVGVFVHAFDFGSDYEKISKAMWTRSSSPGHSILSASIINARTPYLFIGFGSEHSKVGSAGFVITPQAAAASLRCSHAFDASTGTWKTGLIGCIGRYWHFGKWHERRMCAQAVSTPDTSCSWPPSRLEDMMLQHEQILTQKCGNTMTCRCEPRNGVWPRCALYNELILDSQKLVAHMPNAIEAIYFLTGKAALSHDSSRAGEKLAKQAQTMFADVFGKVLPVMRVADFMKQAPFELCDDSGKKAPASYDVNKRQMSKNF
eukprot:gnl/TRDRNA2_/TRDRNA2_176831_c0_seq19.p1 gnl/TRDRNA2_/TRDRNA2_176831_c0~~gnl/TRDRNA2_/TRDRNA2_176831_c0_seq19.p1  ORF type:complete len:374 (-),score=32.60 gnl/TRDRNA2_/TRDRNA2_176831_c0_seq19:152-1273(-)